MRIGFDISVLGRSLLQRRARTGIFRVVDNALRGLLARRDLELALVTAGSWEAACLGLRYVRRHPELAGRWGLGRAPAAAMLSRVIPSGGSLGAKLARAGSLRALRVLDRVRPLALDGAGIDLFHFWHLDFGRLDLTGTRPRVFTVHDLIPLLFPHYFSHGETRRMHAALARIEPTRDHVVCLSEATRRDLLAHTAIPAARICVLPAGASEEFRPTHDPAVLARYGLLGRPYVLSVATLEPRKNLDFLIRAFARYVRETGDRDTMLVLVGTLGWKYGAILDAQRSSAHAGRIVTTGYVDDAHLPALYGGARAFVYPSLYEGFGLPLLEAMQCGAPVIASSISSLPEVVGSAGILIDPTSETTLVQAMRDVLGDEARRADLAARSLTRAREFSWNAFTEGLAGLYARALG